MKGAKVATLHKKPVLLRSLLHRAVHLKCMESDAPKDAVVLVAPDKVFYTDTVL